MRLSVFCTSVCLFAVVGVAGDGTVSLPLERNAYFIGEIVPVVLRAEEATGNVRLAATLNDEKTVLYHGPPGPLLLDTDGLAEGMYHLTVDGEDTGTTLSLASTLRPSAGSLQDEVLPADGPQLSREDRKDPATVARKEREHEERILQAVRESGLTACFCMGAAGMTRRPVLDTLADEAVLVFANPDTRPTSFNPVHVDPIEIDGMSQRMILTAQANGRYPNFAGFCFGWDAAGFRDYGRKGLLIYWGWGDKADDLRAYIDREQGLKEDEFRRRTGLAPVTEPEYIAYLLATGRPEFAPAIDLPTKLWLEEMAEHMAALPAGERTTFEKRLDAWSAYLMELYDHAYSRYAANLRSVCPELRNTSSVQIDHSAVMHGQYIPAAYPSLDLHYQSTWNDQVGGPDYAYQWLFTQALLNTHRDGKPTWISNAFGAVHARADIPGKFVRVAAHGLAHGCSGAGFAHEAFSNLLGGMNKHSSWQAIREGAGGADVRAGRDFLDRFAVLALEGRGRHGVGVLYSRSQLGRQYVTTAFGQAMFNVLVSLTRLGYTPRYVTEEELAGDGVTDVAALVVVNQTVPLPGPVSAGIVQFVARGGKVFHDASTTIRLPGASELRFAHPFRGPGKPHNWSSPNTPAGVNDTHLFRHWHAELAPPLFEALDETGHAWLISAHGADTATTLMQIDGGKDVDYIVAINDASIRSQADWHEVRDTLSPCATAPSDAVVYDCTEERELGGMGPVACDLSRTTARVFAVVSEKVRRTKLAATQRVAAGTDLTVSVHVEVKRGRVLEGVFPFQLSVIGPDRKTFASFYRGTGRDGRFEMAIPIPANVAPGDWRVAVRSQLSGEETSLKVKVTAPAPAEFAYRLEDTIVVRERAAIQDMTRRGRRLVIPVFDSPHHDALLRVAERAEFLLERNGVQVEVCDKPELATYHLAYRTTPEQMAENARVDAGDAIGRVKRSTVNHNDWFGGESGYQFGLPVLLFDLADVKGDSPIAEALDGAGAVWPRVSADFPGAGGATVQAIRWAVGPRADALVIQSVDERGLLNAVARLTDLPDDFLSASVRRARSALLRQYHVGGLPRSPAKVDLSSWWPRTRHRPSPFRIDFPGKTPPAPEDVVPKEPVDHPIHAVPVAVEPKQYVPFYRVDGTLTETATAQFLLRDLRFSEAIGIRLQTEEAETIPVVAKGTFRYSDRQPRSQPQWESVLNLRSKLVPAKRKPMSIDVLVGDKIIGVLRPTKTDTRDMPIGTVPWYVKEKPPSVNEEIVIELSGDISLQAGTSQVFFVHHHIVDGYLDELRMGNIPDNPLE